MPGCGIPWIRVREREGREGRDVIDLIGDISCNSMGVQLPRALYVGRTKFPMQDRGKGWKRKGLRLMAGGGGGEHEEKNCFGNHVAIHTSSHAREQGEPLSLPPLPTAFPHNGRELLLTKATMTTEKATLLSFLYWISQ